MSNYPEIESERKMNGTTFVCETCNKECKEGYNIEWRVSWFQGDNEFEKECLDCRKSRLHKETEKARIIREKYDKYIKDLRAWEKRNQHVIKKQEEREEKKAQSYKKTQKVVANSKKKALENKYIKRGFKAEAFTEWQVRLNDKIDIYPNTYKYFYIPKKEWGEYESEKQLFKKFNI